MHKRKWPRLSETLPHTREPQTCQACGAIDELVVWQECDDADVPEQIYVVLCVTCSDHLIEKHPRLYHDEPRNKPLPGAMPQCAACHHRLGLACLHPLLTSNGGPGLLIKSSVPTLICFDGMKGGRRHGWTEQRYAAVPKCSGLNGAGVGAIVGRIAPDAQNSET